MNNSKNKAMIYPFQKKDIPFIRYFESFCGDIVIDSVCSHKGSGLIGKDIAYSANRNSLGVTVKEVSTEMIDSSDVVIILSDLSDNLKKLSIELMIRVAEAGKKIMCFLDISDEEQEKIKSKCNTNQCLFCQDVRKKDQALLNDVASHTKKMHATDIPIVFVGGLTEQADQVEVALGITKEFRNRGYRVSTIVNSEVYNIFGLHSYSCSLKEEKAVQFIRSFNYLIKAIETTENPEIIIIELPGTMIRYNDLLTGDFGVYTYYFTQACVPDYTICCVPTGDYVNEFFKMLSKDFENKFNFKIDCLHFSNPTLDFANSEQYREIRLFNLPIHKVEEVIAGLENEMTIPLHRFNISNSEHVIADSILERLTE